MQRTLGAAVMAGLFMAMPAARGQDTPAPGAQRQVDARGQTTTTGVAVTSSRHTVVVRDKDGQYQLFVFDRYTKRPQTLTPGSTVRVVSVPGVDEDSRLALEITLEGPAAATAPGESTVDPAVPPSVRRVERDIQRQLRRYQAGVRTGVALDPELVLVGAHAQVGPFFNPDIFFRPNIEVAVGEVTGLIALNLEAIYRLPVSGREGRWTAYVGGGPGFNFVNQSFDRVTGEGRRIDFNNLTTDATLNILGGMRYRSGLFVELKTSVYSTSAPTMRLIVGVNF